MRSFRKFSRGSTGAGRTRARSWLGGMDSPDEDLPEPGPETLAGVALRFQLFVAGVRDYAIFMLDSQGHVTTWNKGAERIKGYRAEEIIGRHMSRFYTREDVEGGLPARLLETAETEGQVEHEGWRVRKDGSRFWASVSITAVRDARGKLEGFGKVTRDLTERKTAEDGRNRGEEVLKALFGRMVDVQDQERKRIALSLSDSTSPAFASLLSKLYQAKERAEGDAGRLIDDSIALTEFLSREIRTVSYLLHPPTLEIKGLLPTLRTHLEGLARQRRMTVDIEFPAQLERLPRPAEETLYRIVQECLTSVLRVSGNSRAKVRLAVREGELILEVGDKGRGISREALEDAKRGLGELGVAIAGMKERMARLGGSLQIHSSLSRTWVTATLPVAGAALPSLSGIAQPPPD